MSLTLHTFAHRHSIYIHMDAEDNPWFSLDVIAPLLGYIDGRYQQKIDRDDRRLINTNGLLPHDSVFVNESGLFQLLLHTNNYTSMTLRKWLMGSLLPQIRRQSKGCLEHYMSEFSYWTDRQLPHKDSSYRGYVYVATSDLYRVQNIYLIGSTANLNMRMVSLNCGRADDDPLFYILKKHVDHRHIAEMDMCNTLREYQQKPSRKDVFIVPDIAVLIAVLKNQL